MQPSGSWSQCCLAVWGGLNQSKAKSTWTVKDGNVGLLCITSKMKTWTLIWLGIWKLWVNVEASSTISPRRSQLWQWKTPTFAYFVSQAKWKHGLWYGWAHENYELTWSHQVPNVATKQSISCPAVKCNHPEADLSAIWLFEWRGWI